MLALTVDQGTEDWHAARAGRFTASRFADAIALDKRTFKRTKVSMSYLLAVAAERMTGVPPEEINARPLLWGKTVEATAREHYEMHTGEMVRQVGFLVHEKYDFIGGSPDGLVGSDGGIEMKCPYNSAVHVATLLHGMPDDHIDQVQGNMFVTCRAWWDFVSFDPRMPPEHRLYIQRIERDEAYMRTLEMGLLQAEAEVNHIIKTINEARVGE